MRLFDLNNVTFFLEWIVIVIIIKSALSKIVCGGTGADVDVITARQSIALNAVFKTKCIELNLPPLWSSILFSSDTTLLF